VQVSAAEVAAQHHRTQDLALAQVVLGLVAAGHGPVRQREQSAPMGVHPPERHRQVKRDQGVRFVVPYNRSSCRCYIGTSARAPRRNFSSADGFTHQSVVSQFPA
jgi:hypothetical protein